MQFKSFALLALATAAPAVLAQAPAGGAAGATAQASGALDPAALAQAAAGLGLTNATALACVVGCVTRAAEANACPRGVSDPACYCDKQAWLDATSACSRANCSLSAAEERGGMVLLNQTCTAALAPRPFTLRLANASVAANASANGTHNMAGMSGNSSKPGGGKHDGALGARVDNRQLFVAVAAGLGGSIVAGLALL